MTPERTLILGLLVFIGIREIFYWYQLNVMVNKLMSRSFYDYKLANAVTPTQPEAARLRVEEEEAEDMNSLIGIG